MIRVVLTLTFKLSVSTCVGDMCSLFFFRQKTAYELRISDWSSDVCSSDLLARVAPDYGFLGEEGGLVEGRDKRHVWIVDPLDGTANFLIGLPIFAVNKIGRAHV